MQPGLLRCWRTSPWLKIGERKPLEETFDIPRTDQHKEPWFIIEEGRSLTEIDGH
jgi:hypothetical protein